MPIIVLIPALIVVIALFRDSPGRAFLNVYIPILMMVPVYYFWKVANLPPIDPAEAALFPLGIAICFSSLRRWRFDLTDLAVALFLLTAFLPDLLHGESTAAIFELFSTLCLAVVPYMAGKLLIEQNDLRVPVLKRMVFCLFLASLLSVYEFRMSRNPFTMLVAPLFPTETFPWKTQLRWGHGRVSGPFGQSELAGMMFFTTLVFTLWLTWARQWERKFALVRWLPFRKSTVIACTLGIVFLMTQARGPWIGALVAIPVALIGRSRRVLRSTLLVAAMFVVVAPLAYVGIKSYTSGRSSSEAQQNAQYRSELLDNYIPVARAGGPFGWGQRFPRIGHQESIDNEYLFVALTQGLVGFFAFCFIAGKSLSNAIDAAMNGPTQADRYFAFSLTGILLGLSITIFTVFLGNQPFQLFFLLAGWSQAIRTSRTDLAVEPTPAPAFRQVYT